MAGVGSFRLSGFKQRGTIAAVIRCITVRDPDDRRASTCRRCSRTLVMEKRGLILMVGATGSGK